MCSALSGLAGSVVGPLKCLLLVESQSVKIALTSMFFALFVLTMWCKFRFNVLIDSFQKTYWTQPLFSRNQP